MRFERMATLRGPDAPVDIQAPVVSAGEDAEDKLDERSLGAASACHAGWYLAAKALEDTERGNEWAQWGRHDTPLARGGPQVLCKIHETGRPEAMGFAIGVRCLNDDLGLDDVREFADTHAEWWGNEHGAYMFDGPGMAEAALGMDVTCQTPERHLPDLPRWRRPRSGVDPGVTLGDIARHWRTVAQRTPAR